MPWSDSETPASLWDVTAAIDKQIQQVSETAAFSLSQPCTSLILWSTYIRVYPECPMPFGVCECSAFGALSVLMLYRRRIHDT